MVEGVGFGNRGAYPLTVELDDGTTKTEARVFWRTLLEALKQ